MRFISKTKLFLSLLTLVLLSATTSLAQASADDSTITFGTLEELRDKRKAHLMIISSDVVDVREPERGVAEAVRARKEAVGRRRRIYTDIAKRLNKYIRKYGSMIGVDNADDADFIVVFNFLRYRRILYSLYASGEMYVVLDRPDEPMRILWKTEKEMLSEDATSKLIEALKTFRREK